MSLGVLVSDVGIIGVEVSQRRILTPLRGVVGDGGVQYSDGWLFMLQRVRGTWARVAV